MKKQTYKFIDEDGEEITRIIINAQAVITTPNKRYIHEGDLYECAYWLIERCSTASEYGLYEVGHIKTKLKYEDMIFTLKILNEDGTRSDITNRIDWIINKCMKHRKGVK